MAASISPIRTASSSTSPAEVRERYLEAGGLRIRYFEAGSGPAVLLLHGAALGSSADVWENHIDGLASHGLRAIAFDQPGFGLSDAPPDFSLGFRTRLVPQMLVALGLREAFVMAHSQSGRIAVNLAMQAPGRFRRAVVVGTASLLPPLPGATKGDTAEGEEDAACEPSMDDARALLESQVFDRSQITPERVALRYEMSIGRNFDAHRARQAAKGRGTKKDESRPLWQRLAEVPVPLRLVYGRQDRSAEARAALARELHPSIDLQLLDRCGHLVMWDQPEALLRLGVEHFTASVA